MYAGTKLYHQTDHPTARIILETQEMKPGSRGRAGGGIYFATTPELTGHKAHKGTRITPVKYGTRVQRTVFMTVLYPLCERYRYTPPQVMMVRVVVHSS